MESIFFQKEGKLTYTRVADDYENCKINGLFYIYIK